MVSGFTYKLMTSIIVRSLNADFPPHALIKNPNDDNLIPSVGKKVIFADGVEDSAVSEVRNVFKEIL